MRPRLDEEVVGPERGQAGWAGHSRGRVPWVRELQTTQPGEVASAESRSQQIRALHLPVSRGWRVVVAPVLRWKTHPALSMTS